MVSYFILTMPVVAQEEASMIDDGSTGGGHRQVNENIVGGTLVLFGKYPWYAIPDATTGSFHLCGASLIWKSYPPFIGRRQL